MPPEPPAAPPRVVPVPGPKYRTEKVLYEPNYLKNITVYEAPEVLDVQFDKSAAGRFQRIITNDHESLRDSINELARERPQPNQIHHWHLMDTTSIPTIRPRYSHPPPPQPQPSVLVHCAPREPSQPVDVESRLSEQQSRRIRHRQRDYSFNSCTAPTHYSRGSSSSSQINFQPPPPNTTSEVNRRPAPAKPAVEICRREFILPNGKRHFIFDVTSLDHGSEAGRDRMINLEFPVLHRQQSQPAVVPWCVQDEPYTVTDDSVIEYIDEFYWVPKIVYDARLDKDWCAEQAHLFNQLPDGATLPANVITAFTNRNVTVNDQRRSEHRQSSSGGLMNS